MSKDDYQKHLRNNITKTHKKSNRNRVNDINLAAKKIKLKIDGRVEKMQETEAFLTIKGHKKGFPHTLSFRLINRSKSDIVKICKSLLDSINENILKQTNVNQWKNTSQVMTWFKNIKSKKASSFVNFDVENFYPSISIDLFTDAISYAKAITNINDDQLSIIMQSRKTLLFNNNEPWIKKSGEENFDVPIGCYDGAEVCELVGRYILNKLKNVTNKENIGLYRDDGLGISQNIPKTEIERNKKQTVKVFKECGLSITVKCNSKSVDFLDVTFDLVNEICKPYRKPNNKPLYINKHSNHPPKISKQLSPNPLKNVYLKRHQTLIYSLQFTIPAPRNNDENQKRKRKRNIIWFNPPYSKNVTTNIGKTFLQLLSKHFPKDHQMH